MLWAGYTRVSRVGDRGERLISPELQEARIRAYAESRGLEVEMMEPELDVSGGRSDRPILNEVIHGIEQGRFAGVIVAQLDRLSRLDLLDALQVIRRIEELGGRAIAVAENFDSSTPEGRMARNVHLSISDMYLSRSKIQFAQVKRRAVEHGIWPMPIVPFGYRKREDRRLEPAPQTAPLVVEAFTMRAAGASIGQVADRLSAGDTGARKILSNRVYLGEVRLRVGGEEIVNRSAHEPIVPVDLFEACQIAQPRPPRNLENPALLGGLIRCAACGDVMSIVRQSDARSYACRPRKAGRRCEAPAIIGEVGVNRLVEQTVLRHIASMVVTASDRNQQLEQAEQALRDAEAELDAYQRATAVAQLGAEVFARGMTERAEAVQDARRKVAEARLRSTPLPAPADVEELWPDLSVSERRHVLRGALAAVVVAKGRGLERVRLFEVGTVLDFPVGDVPGEIRPAMAEDV